jgi:large subunit ribosomal protein L25
MTAKIALTAELREGTGKGTARAIRREKKIPAVIYGNNQAPVTIAMSEKDITLQYHKGHMFTTLVDISVNGKTELVLTRDIQTHVVTDKILHADFLRVSPKTKIHVMIPVHFINHEASPALKAKAILNVVRHEIDMNCVATDIPENITFDLTGKDFGDAVRISDAKLPNGVTPVITDRDFTVATLVEAKGAGTDEDAAAAAPATEAKPA